MANNIFVELMEWLNGFAFPCGLVSNAKDVTHGTGVGVMTSTGII